MSATYNIKISQFEGPFDLLLFFIERDELDIHDIPIAKITDDFLNYLHRAEQMNIDLASEFILVAATLCRIKVKMLIPRKQVDEQGNEIDPREELVQRLLEYRRYKSILEEMRELETLRSLQNARGNIAEELSQIAVKALVDSELESVTLFKLLKTFERLVRRFEDAKPRTIHEIAQFSYTIEAEQNHLLGKMDQGKKLAFQHVFEDCKNRIHAIVTFLAMLELLNQELIRITLGLGTNNFWLSRLDGTETLVEGAT